MGRRRNTEARRAQIVEALLSVMAAEGYAGASIQSIARVADLSPGLIHYHFPNKQSILLALLETLSSRLTERYTARLTEPLDPWQALCAWIDAHLAVGEDADPRAVACWVQISAEALRQPAVRQAYQDALAQDFAVLLAHVQALSGSAAIAAGLMAAVQGAYQIAMTAPQMIPPGSAAGTVREMAAGLLGRPHADL